MTYCLTADLINHIAKITGWIWSWTTDCISEKSDMVMDSLSGWLGNDGTVGGWMQHDWPWKWLTGWLAATNFQIPKTWLADFHVLLPPKKVARIFSFYILFNPLSIFQAHTRAKKQETAAGRCRLEGSALPKNKLELNSICLCIKIKQNLNYTNINDTFLSSIFTSMKLIS